MGFLLESVVESLNAPSQKTKKEFSLLSTFPMFMFAKIVEE